MNLRGWQQSFARRSSAQARAINHRSVEIKSKNRGYQRRHSARKAGVFPSVPRHGPLPRGLIAAEVCLCHPSSNVQLGVAKAASDGDPPDSQRDFAFNFMGLVGLADPVRASVPAALRECRSAGIRVIMITGDYPATARAIAQQAGLDSGDLMNGAAWASLWQHIYPLPVLLYSRLLSEFR